MLVCRSFPFRLLTLQLKLISPNTLPLFTCFLYMLIDVSCCLFNVRLILIYGPSERSEPKACFGIRLLSRVFFPQLRYININSSFVNVEKSSQITAVISLRGNNDSCCVTMMVVVAIIVISGSNSNRIKPQSWKMALFLKIWTHRIYTNAGGSFKQQAVLRHISNLNWMLALTC